MTILDQQRAFHIKNRQKLAKKHDLVIITGNSFVQASNDNTFPFEQDSHFFYLTGITEPEVILVMDEDEEYLIVPDRDEVRTAFEGPIDVSTIKAVSGIDNVKTLSEAWEGLQERLRNCRSVASIGSPKPYIEHYEMFTNPSRARLISRIKDINPDIEIIDLRVEITKMRMVKAPYELKMIKMAINETIKLFKKIERTRLKAKFESDIWAEAAKFATKNQLKYAYEPIIASGKNAITLHYMKNNQPIDRSGMLLLDVGLRFKGYSADITRTISYNPTTRQQEVFDAVLTVQDYAFSILKPGITLKEYEAKVAEAMGQQLIKLGLIKEISKEAIRKFYPHSTSHFLGLDVHDVADYEIPLKPNMVLTVEPGIYIPGENIGIRLEDDVVITRNGNKNLSNKLPKSLHSLTIES